jgi:hypothetical protein
MAPGSVAVEIAAAYAAATASMRAMRTDSTSASA